jgi:membrane protein
MVKIGEVDVGATAKATFKDFREDDLQGLAAEVAYNLLFSIVPLLIFLAGLTGFIGQWVGEGKAISNVVDWLRRDSNLPPATVDAVIKPITDLLTTQTGGFLSFGALLALWSGKNAIASLMKALNVAFDVKETRPWWKKTAIAMGLTIALGFAIIAASLFFVVGSRAGDTVAGWIGLGSTWTTVWSLLRWPLIVILLTVALAFFFWAGPNVEARFAWLTPGSVLSVVLWAVATLGLGLYFRYFAGYLKTYGILGGLLAFVFWLYVMSLILLLGGELNSVLAREHDPQTQEQVTDPEKRTSGVGAKRRAASGRAAAEPASDETDRDLPPLAPMPAFQALATALPSAEAEARLALTAEDNEDRARRFKRVVAALGAAVAAAISGALVGSHRR